MNKRLHLPYSKDPFRYYQSVSIEKLYFMYFGIQQREEDAVFVTSLEDDDFEEDFDTEDNEFFVSSTWRYSDIKPELDLRRFCGVEE